MDLKLNLLEYHSNRHPQEVHKVPPGWNMVNIDHLNKSIRMTFEQNYHEVQRFLDAALAFVSIIFMIIMKKEHEFFSAKIFCTDSKTHNAEQILY